MARPAEAAPITAEAARDLLRPHLARPDVLDPPLTHSRLLERIADDLNRLRERERATKLQRADRERNRRAKVFAEAAKHAREMAAMMEATGLWPAADAADLRSLAEAAERARGMVPSPSEPYGSSQPTSHGKPSRRGAAVEAASPHLAPVLALARLHMGLDAPFRPTGFGAKSPTTLFVVDAMRAIGGKPMTAGAVAKALERSPLAKAT